MVSNRWNHGPRSGMDAEPADAGCAATDAAAAVAAIPAMTRRMFTRTDTLASEVLSCSPAS